MIPLTVSLLVCGLLVAFGEDRPADQTVPNQAAQSADGTRPQPPSAEEARQRARLLHETFHATLQFVHTEYYRPNERLTLPASTLERVFKELERSHNVRLRWLAVNAQAMNVDHEPRDDFDKACVAALKDGQSEFDRVENNVLRYAGAITLSSDCLKCHLPARTNVKDRIAALVISIPVSPNSDSP